jgi:3-phenylpropionate/trans-cinnamate dioxygenase ferredoxin reductase subunit
VSGVVVVGGGQAGGTAVGKLRDEGYDGSITLIGEEPDAPYERPPLSKEFLRGERDDHAPVRPDGWYAEQGVEVLLGVRAERVDTDGRAVETTSGRVPYDELILATGSRNRHVPIPGIELAGVYGLRSRTDAERLRDAAASASKAVLVGMGFIGAEVASSLRHRGIDVTVIEGGGTPLERVLGNDLGKTIERLHRDHGVEMHFAQSVERFEGDGRFEAVVTSAGTRVEADFAVVGVGVQPNVELAEASDIPVDNGILVDATLHTPLEGVWSIGDVARHEHPVFGSVRVEHFDNAVKMGEHVGRSIAHGERITFDDPHWFWSDQYDANLQYAGFHSTWEQLVVRGRLGSDSFLACYVNEGRIDAAVALNRAKDLRRVMPLIKARRSFDLEQLRDESVDLRSLLASS